MGPLKFLVLLVMGPLKILIILNREPSPRLPVCKTTTVLAVWQTTYAWAGPLEISK